MTEAAQKSMLSNIGTLSGAIGKRVTIRLHEPSGGYKDIVGILQSDNHLINSKAESIFFSPDEIAIWREIKPQPDLAGKGAPLSQRILELEKLSDLTWPADRVIDFGKWRLRISDGFTMRANSALPLGAGPIGEPPIDIEGAVNEVINIYRENKLTPTFTVALPIYEELDLYLDKTGWSKKVTANFLIRDIGEREFADNKEFTCEVLDFPTKSWLEIQSDQPLENLMTRYPARYGAIKNGDQIVAVGRIATYGTWSIVTRLFVEPTFRGKGVAKFLMNNLLAAARSDGATKVGLQVDEENASALALYESMEFRTHHKFVYRSLMKKRDK